MVAGNKNAFCARNYRSVTSAILIGGYCSVGNFDAARIRAVSVLAGRQCRFRVLLLYREGSHVVTALGRFYTGRFSSEAGYRSVARVGLFPRMVRGRQERLLCGCKWPRNRAASGPCDYGIWPFWGGKLDSCLKRGPELRAQILNAAAELTPGVLCPMGMGGGGARSATIRRT